MSEHLKNKIYLERKINPFRLQAILDNAGQSILDVGCGNGSYVLKLDNEFPRYKIHGLDYQHFSSWEENPKLFTIGEATNLPYPDETFDTLTLFEVLEHLQNPEEVLKEYFRVVRKNLILTVPNCEYTEGMKKSLLTYYHYTDETHVNFFSLKSITDIVKMAGFGITKAYYINELSLWPLLEEAFMLKGITGSILKSVLSRRLKKKYPITILIVASKLVVD